MTISKQTAKDVAEKVFSRAEQAGVQDPLSLCLDIVEDLYGVNGNKSFRESLDLIHLEVKNCYIDRAIRDYTKKNPAD